MAELKAPRLSKRMKTVRAKVDRNKFYALDDALLLVKENAIAKFDDGVYSAKLGGATLDLDFTEASRRTTR